MTRSSHNGALVFGLLLGAAGGALWAVWNTTGPGEKLRADTRAMIDAALGRTHDASLSREAAPKPAVERIVPIDEIPLDGNHPIESSALSQ